MKNLADQMVKWAGREPAPGVVIHQLWELMVYYYYLTTSIQNNLAIYNVVQNHSCICTKFPGASMHRLNTTKPTFF